MTTRAVPFALTALAASAAGIPGALLETAPPAPPQPLHSSASAAPTPANLTRVNIAPCIIDPSPSRSRAFRLAPNAIFLQDARPRKHIDMQPAQKNRRGAASLRAPVEFRCDRRPDYPNL